MAILGLATAEEFAQADRRLDRLDKDLERRMRDLERRPAPLTVPQTINLAGGSIGLGELLEQVVALIKPQLREAIEEAMRALDWEDLTERAWDAVALDELTEKLAAALIEKVPDLVDRDALRRQLVETLLDEHVDFDDLADRVGSTLSDRLEVRLGSAER